MATLFENPVYFVAAKALSTLWPFIPILILILLFKTSWFKGLFGEYTINLSLRLRLGRKDYRLLKDLTLRTPDGTTQIDHLVVSRFGVFVIETKNMKGRIFGNEKHARWTQKLYRRSYRFQNPLRQNYKHVKTVQELLEIPRDTIHNVVVFIGDATLKTDMPANVACSGHGLARYIKSHAQEVFDKSAADDMVKRLTDSRLKRGIKTNRAHRKHLREAKAGRRTGISKNPSATNAPDDSKTNRAHRKRPREAKAGRRTGISKNPSATNAPDDSQRCPVCGCRMVIRTKRRSGERFLGCPRFPKCRGIRALPQED